MRTVTVTSDTFVDMARIQAHTLGRGDLALVVIPHPLAGLASSDARERGRAAGHDLLRMLSAPS